MRKPNLVWVAVIGAVPILLLAFQWGSATRSRNLRARQLRAAVESRSLQRVAQLLAGGVEVGTRDREGCTPLHRAAALGEVPIVRLLLESHAQVDARDNHGCTPLLDASSTGELEAVEMLLDAGAAVNTRNVGGATPLLTASQGGYPKVVQRLLQAHADPTVRDVAGQTALDLASDALRIALASPSGATSHEQIVSARQVIRLLEASAPSRSPTMPAQLP